MTETKPTKIIDAPGARSELAIYVDGSKAVGLGHLTRMRTLVRRVDAQSRIFTRTPLLCRQVFAEIEVEVVALTEGEQLSDAISNFSPSARVVVLDPPYEPLFPHDCSGPAWQPEIDRIRARGLKVVRFTDEERATAHSCDVLVNDHPDSELFAETYRVFGEISKIMAGARYFLIEFSPKPPAVKADKVFVSFGGSDQSDLVNRFVPSIFNIAKTYFVEICVGTGKQLSHKLPDNVIVHNFLESEDFAQKMASAKVSITASGNTLFERVAYGVPGLSVAQFPRQDRIGWAFQNMGLTKHLGLGTEVEPRRLIGALHHLINDQYEMQAQIAATSDISMRSGAAEIVNAVQDLIT